MIVIKLGGGEGIDPGGVVADIAALQAEGQQVLLVHGGSHLTNQVAEALGHPPSFITSPSGFTSRLTDRRTIEIFEMVYCGQVNKAIVERMQAAGINAVGLSGIDGGLWRGPRKGAIRAVENGKQRVIRDTYTGQVEEVNTHLLTTLLDAGFTPVLTPPAISYENEAINVDGDRAAAATAAALGADTLIILSNVPGVLRDFPDRASLIDSIRRADLDSVIETHAEGRMKIKLLAAGEALDAGVLRVVIGDAGLEAPVRRALEGAGSVIA